MCRASINAGWESSLANGASEPRHPGHLGTFPFAGGVCTPRCARKLSLTRWTPPAQNHRSPTSPHAERVTAWLQLGVRNRPVTQRGTLVAWYRQVSALVYGACAGLTRSGSLCAAHARLSG